MPRVIFQHFPKFINLELSRSEFRKIVSDFISAHADMRLRIRKLEGKDCNEAEQQRISNDLINMRSA